MQKTNEIIYTTRAFGKNIMDKAIGLKREGKNSIIGWGYVPV